MIDRVTITGADDSIRPQDLLPISKTYPFVEWGILASSANTGEITRTPRFPSLFWMDEFREMSHRELGATRPSLHLCGRLVRRLLMGELDPFVLQLANGFVRIQLNFHAERNKCDPALAFVALNKIRSCSRYGQDLQFLFQLDGAGGNDHLESITSHFVDIYGEPSNCFGLFDESGGAGVVPKEWPAPIYHTDGVFDYHGYAGGLSPDNLAEQIPLIEKAAGGIRIWIDMESGVRSQNDRQFDLEKVRHCLEIARPFVGVSS